MRSDGGLSLGVGWSPPWLASGFTGASARAAAWPLACLFRLGIGARSLSYRIGLFRTLRVDAAVISVGNIQVGGTGKTPFCRWVAGKVASQGIPVAIVTRGYGGSRAGPVFAGGKGKAERSVEEVGDEAIMLAKTSAALVVTGRDRAKAAQYAVSDAGVQVVILDDGFQHRRLARDLDIVLVDGREQDYRLLPAGPLREPPSALARADIVLRTCRGDDEPDGGLGSSRPFHRPERKSVPWSATVNLAPQSLVTSERGIWRELPLAELAGRRAVVVTGVANPGPLYGWLKEWELQVDGVIEKPDHHHYTAKDWQVIARAAEKVDLVVTTEKDLVKLERFPFAVGKLVALRVGVEIAPEDVLVEEILRVATCSRLLARQPRSGG